MRRRIFDPPLDPPAETEAAGAPLTDEPHERPWGIYSGYFRNPDGHLWEVIWNPASS